MIKTLNAFLGIFLISALISHTVHSEASISTSLRMRMKRPELSAFKPTLNNTAMVTIRFTEPPSSSLIDELENKGLTFSRSEGHILHTLTVYPATLRLDSLDVVASHPNIVRIEDSDRFNAASTLDISNPLVQADQAWELHHGGLPIDGTGVIIANIDTGIDIFNPAFFYPNGGSYQWIDQNNNNQFDPGIDAVDLNGSGTVDNNENLNFIDAAFVDAQHIMDVDRTDDVYDAGFDWLYNDANLNGNRNYGLNSGYSEDSPSFGEQFFICDDSNMNGRLDPGEMLTGLGTSKVIAIYSGSGIYERGVNLLNAPPENITHGTPAAGIAIGQSPGRRFAGIAPGAEIIAINRYDLPDQGRSVESGILWAKEHGAKIFMHEFGSWIGEFLDGSSNYETMITEQIADGMHHFTASGNLAGPLRKKHAALNLQRYETKTLGISINKSNNVSTVYISILWNSPYPFIKPDVTFRLKNGVKQSLDMLNYEYTIDEYLVNCYQDYNAQNTRRFDIVLYNSMENQPVYGEYFLDILFSNSYPDSLEIDAFIADDKTSWAGGAQFTTYITDDGIVTSPGTAVDVVTVGAYSPRGYRSRIQPDTPGDICDFSGWGKTIDGRIAVDITAPGYTVFSPTTFYDYQQNRSWGYTDFNGTSAALPFVSGSAALILQAAPDITPSDLSHVLLDDAKTDYYVLNGYADYPNDTWGYGKLHIFDSLVNSGLVTPVLAEEIPTDFILSQPYPNPFNTTTRIDVNYPANFNKPLDCYIYNIMGQTVRHFTINSINNNSQSIVWDGKDDLGAEVSTGIYIISIKTELFTQIARAVYLK